MRDLRIDPTVRRRGARCAAGIVACERQRERDTNLHYIDIGGVAAFWATRVLGTMLFQVGARDPIVYVAASLVLLIVAVAASLLPARRAAGVDPVRALGAQG